MGLGDVAGHSRRGWRSDGERGRGTWGSSRRGDAEGSGVHLDDHGNVVFDVGSGGVGADVASKSVVVNLGRKRDP